MNNFAGKISVLIVDDHPPIREGIRAMIEKTDDLCVAGEAQNGEEARRLLDEFRPRVVLLDLVMPGFSPFTFEKWARENYPDTVTLVLTSHDRDAYLANMLEAGVAGYLNKDISPDRLISAIRRAAYGDNLIDDSQKVRARHWKEDIEQKWNSLSEREKEILRLLSIGATNKFISRDMAISLRTVDKHIENIYKKLGVISRIEAAQWGQENHADFTY